ncbi:MAG: hypothetical protein SF053_16175 [Bacteroidia bacterium]|nr:hypothetical protein [Bacteroidia bacterium]
MLPPVFGLRTQPPVQPKPNLHHTQSAQPDVDETTQERITIHTVQRQPDTAGGDKPADPEPITWSRLQVYATGMDHAALLLAQGKLTFDKAKDRNQVFVGLHPQFVKVYDHTGKSLGNRVPLKETKGLSFKPGVYVNGPKGIFALTISSDNKNIGAESSQSVIGQRPYTEKEKAAMAEELKKAEAEGRQPQPAPPAVVNFMELLTDAERFRSMVARVSDPLVIYFAPTYDTSGAGKGNGESKGIYASPIEGRGDGQPANAPPWPVSMEGPKLVPVDADPTYSAKIDWAANGNSSTANQVISQIGQTIHYKWELFDITQYAKKQIAKDPAGTKDGAKPEQTLEQRIEAFKNAKSGTGKDVTGMGGANREFKREFEDWWKDTKRAAKGAKNPNGDTVGERLSNSAANRLSLELAPVTLLTTAVGAVLKWLADLFAGPRQQQEIPLEKEGIFLIRVISTPGIQEDTEGKPVVRPPSVAARVTEVTPMDRAVQESLDEPGAQLAELQAQIDLAEKEGNTAKAEYLRDLLAQARVRFEGSPLELLKKKREEKQKELEKFQKEYPTLSDYSRKREVELLDDQMALYDRHERVRKEGSTEGLGAMRRANATLISEVTGEQYPLLVSVGPMAMNGTQYQWMISDVTNRDGDAFIGLGDKPSTALQSALKKFGGKAAYGRGRIGLRTTGLGLEDGAPKEMLVDSAPADWALAEKRIDDLVTTLALLGLTVASAGTAGALIGAGVAAARLVQRWQAGKLYLDAQTVSDMMGVLGGLGAAGQLAGGLRVQKFEKMFAITQEGKATEAQIIRAAEALKGAQGIAKAVEVANEVLNYGGLLWGNISFMDQMMTISDQERTGAITHAAARRARATAISSAVQNNGLFIAGNVMKAKQAAAKDKAKTTPEKSSPTPEKTPPQEHIPTEPLPKDKGPSDDAPTIKPEEAPKTPQPDTVPLSERQATPAELKAALPADIQKMLVIDDKLQGDTAKAEYTLDPATGLISEITLRCSPDARPATVALHTETVRTMQKYQGFSGRVRQAISWIADIVGIDTVKPENKAYFEAALEIQKLPKLIEAQMARMRQMEPNARDLAEAELAKLELQLEKHMNTLDIGGGGQGVGYVAGEGLSKAKQKQYAELKAKLRGLEAGSDTHKETRWEMYQLIGGDMPRATWEKVYAGNMGRAKKASASVNAEHKRLGWGTPEQTVNVGKDEVRRIDIADKQAKKGVEVKAYETGYIAASEDIVWEVQRDAKLVKRGWQITWVMLDTTPSSPLLQMLLKAGITVEIRNQTPGGNSTLEARHSPPPPGTKQTK